MSTETNQTCDIPEWAFDRVHELAQTSLAATPLRTAFAAYIATHEEAPVDPLEAAAKVLADEYFDNDENLEELCLRALRRGIELCEAGEA